MRAIFSIVSLPSPTLQQPEKYSRDVVEFITLCLDKEPSSRAKSDTLITHPWIIDAQSKPMQEVLKDYNANMEKAISSGTADIAIMTNNSSANNGNSGKINSQEANSPKVIPQESKIESVSKSNESASVPEIVVIEASTKQIREHSPKSEKSSGRRKLRDKSSKKEMKKEYRKSMEVHSKNIVEKDKKLHKSESLDGKSKNEIKVNEVSKVYPVESSESRRHKRDKIDKIEKTTRSSIKKR